MAAAENNADRERFKTVVECVRDLSGNAFLGLEAAREDFKDAGQFRKADDASIGNVANVSDAEEWNEMVFAEREHGEVPLKNHLAVVFGAVLEHLENRARVD